jgi:hypothetical protein
MNAQNSASGLSPPARCVTLSRADQALDVDARASDRMASLAFSLTM